MSESPLEQPLSQQQLLGLLVPGSRVFIGGGLACPNGVVRLLNDNPEKTAGVEFLQARLPGIATVDVSTLGPGATLTTIFMAPALEGQPWLRFVPAQYRRFYDWLRRRPIDLALVRGLRDENNRVNLGLSADFAPAAIASGARVVVEVGSGDPTSGLMQPLPADAVAGTFVSGEELPVAHLGSRGDVEERIGRNVAGLVDDGDCLQTGVGAIPDAVLDSLSSHRHLGFHSGMLCDGARKLIDAGVITGERKTRDRGRHVTGFVYGDADLYGWAVTRDDLDLRPVSYTHDAGVLASLDNLVIVNSAVQVDLFGQINAEMIGARQISGTGGAVDFFRGAALGRGGRSIVALPSTAARGSRSRIVVRLDPPGVATALRTDCDYVVTEFGVASLSGRTVDERAEALIGVSAPEFRRELEERWQSGC